jgi:phosphoribosylanthranilate isomerase
VKTRVKVCCISSVDEARLAVQHGASAVGFVSAMPSGPGVIPEALIATIAAGVPPGVATFLLTSARSAAAIIEQQRRLRVNTLQLCDELEDGAYHELRRALPGVGLVQVIHVAGEESIGQAVDVAPFVDAILLDSGNPRLLVKELGGTGRRHDWKISRRIRDAVPVPIYLAGGLLAENVTEAIATVRPFALDVCSGVRSNGGLDADKLHAFFAAMQP